jgi:hypothetical protein
MQQQVAVRAHVEDWLARHGLGASEVDCANAVMLKILDGKCKMPPMEKRVMSELYRQLGRRCGGLLGPSVHALVAAAGERPDDEMRACIYEQRVLAESMIARPVMKAFKAMIRDTGLLEVVPDSRKEG